MEDILDKTVPDVMTEIIIVQDKSGSMEGIRTDTIGAYNQFLEEQKALPGHCLLTLCLFDTEDRIVHDGIALAEVPRMTEADFRPSGMTALYDAIGRTVDKVLKRQSSQRQSPRTLLVINTDGLENSSHEYNADTLKALLERLQSEHQWEVLYLGANQDAMLEGERIGSRRSVNFAATPEGISRSYRKTSESARAMRRLLDDRS